LNNKINLEDKITTITKRRGSKGIAREIAIPGLTLTHDANKSE